METSKHRPVHRVVAAWAVHALTASGAVAGFMALAAATAHSWKAAFVWMGMTIAIDAVDGTFARLARVREFAPHLDGALLDNIVDYFTYVAVPAYVIYASGVVSTGGGVLAASAILLASAYQFCQMDAKTSDHYFKGFPSYWNIVAFYVFMLGLPGWLNLAIVLALAAAVFAPVEYLYPSRAPFLQKTTLALSGVWAGIIIAVLVRYPEPSPLLLRGSLLYVVYYAGVSFYATAAKTRKRRSL